MTRTYMWDKDTGWAVGVFVAHLLMRTRDNCWSLAFRLLATHNGSCPRLFTCAFAGSGEVRSEIPHNYALSLLGESSERVAPQVLERFIKIHRNKFDRNI